MERNCILFYGANVIEYYWHIFYRLVKMPRSGYLDLVVSALKKKFGVKFHGIERIRSIGGENTAIDVNIFGENMPILAWTESYLADGYSRNSHYGDKLFAPYEFPTERFVHEMTFGVLENTWFVERMFGKLVGSLDVEGDMLIELQDAHIHIEKIEKELGELQEENKILKEKLRRFEERDS
ncbi:hypothetical protein ISTM_46 [Insectomime virus]|nr:hypothetical protein ISTM_46 [Insectomime virus]